MTPAGFEFRIPFLDLIGAEREFPRDGRAVISLELTPKHLNTFHVAHGGVVLTMMDMALGMAASTHDGHDPNEMSVVTVDLSVNFLSSARQRIVAEGRILRGGKSLVFCEGEARDGTGALVAKAIGTFKLRRRARDAAAA